MNAKQRRFAREYSVDHNATAAAIRAGYGEGRAKQTGHELLAKPEVAQLVAKLDAEKAESLGIEAEDALAEVLGLLEVAKQTQPKIWKGEPVTYRDPETGETKVAIELVAGSVAIRAAELLWKQAGLDKSRMAVEHTSDVIYTLHLDRDLSAEEDE